MTRLMPRNAGLLERLVPFVVATASVRERLDLRPFGLDVPAANVFDPLHGDATRMLERLRALDAVSFGTGEMAMPRWILLDGAGLSGAIIGLAARADRAGATVLDLLGLSPDYPGLVPYSMYIAIPSFEPDTWVGHNLASLAARRPEGEHLSGLGGLTKAVALRCLRARRQLGAAQWDSIALRVHARLGPLELLTAWTPAHTRPWTFTYAAEVDDARLRWLARDPGGAVPQPQPERWLGADDHAAMQQLQRDIEEGERWFIAGAPGAGRDEPARVPLARG